MSVTPTIETERPLGPHYTISLAYIGPHEEGKACFQMNVRGAPGIKLGGLSPHPGEDQGYWFVGMWPVNEDTVESLNALGGGSMLDLIYARRNRLRAKESLDRHETFWLTAMEDLSRPYSQ